MTSMLIRTLSCEFIRTEHNAGTASRTYDYLYTGGREVRVGDWAVVHNGSVFGIVQIKRIRPGLTDKVDKHVLTIFTQDDYLRYQEANRAIVQHRTVFDQLDYMLEEEKRLGKYADLAAKNPVAADLLKRAQVWDGPTLEHRPFSFDDSPKDTGDVTVKAAE